MKVINLKPEMLPLTYLVRHWGRWYYVDVAGKYMKHQDYEEVINRIQGAK